MNPEVLDMDCTNEKISESLLLLISLKNIKIYTKQPIRMEITQRFRKETSQKLILRTEDYFGTSITFKESPQIQHFFQKTKLLTFRLYKNNQLVSQIKDVNLTKIVKNNLGQLVFKDNNNVNFAWLNLRCEVLLSKDIFKVSVGIKFDKKQLHSQDSIAEYKIVRGQKQKNQQIEVLSSTSYNQLNNDNCFICEEKQVLGAKLCRNNYESLTIKIFHRSSSNQSIKAIWMGSVSFLVEETQVKKQKQFLYSSGIKVGTVWITCQHIQYKKGFLSHLKNGLDIMSVLCIDFTSSNLQYIDEKSKHFFASDKLSDYEQVLETSIEQIMECDKDKHIPTFGFGSIVNHPNYFTNGKVSHRFPLSMDPNKANFSSLDEIRKAYRENMKYLKFAGPTYMAFLMKWAIQECKKILSSEDNYKYMILFILTDGQFCDEEEMRDLIVECSHLPISTVFIGIGDEDFTILEELDDDDAKLVDRNGNPTVRDSVQFVPFEKYKNNLLAFKKEVLAEIPRQIEEYFYFKSKKQQ